MVRFYHTFILYRCHRARELALPRWDPSLGVGTTGARCTPLTCASGREAPGAERASFSRHAVLSLKQLCAVHGWGWPAICVFGPRLGWLTAGVTLEASTQLNVTNRRWAAVFEGPQCPWIHGLAG